MSNKIELAKKFKEFNNLIRNHKGECTASNNSNNTKPAELINKFKLAALNSLNTNKRKSPLNKPQNFNKRFKASGKSLSEIEV